MASGLAFDGMHTLVVARARMDWIPFQLKFERMFPASHATRRVGPKDGSRHPICHTEHKTTDLGRQRGAFPILTWRSRHRESVQGSTFVSPACVDPAGILGHVHAVASLTSPAPCAGRPSHACARARDFQRETQDLASVRVQVFTKLCCDLLTQLPAIAPTVRSHHRSTPQRSKIGHH